MKSRSPNIFSALFIVLFTVAVIAAFVWVMALLPNGMGAVVVAGLLAFLGSIVGKYYEKQLEIQDRIRERKVEVYTKFVSFLFEYTKQVNAGDAAIDTEKFRDFFFDFTAGLVMYGSTNVMKTWNAFKKLAVSDEPASHVLAMEPILKAIRLDLGHEDKDLNQGDILRLFVNDIDQALTPNS